MKVKLFGLPRSGTNYLRWLIAHNFDAVPHKHVCWEHALPGQRLSSDGQPAELTALEATAGLTRVVIYKDRDHWLESIARNTPTSERIILNTHGVPVASLYDRFLAEWAPHARSVRYESFLEDFASTMDYLGTLIGTPPRNYLEPARVPESPHWRPEHRSRYL